MGVRRERWRWLAPLAALAVVACVVSVNRALAPTPVPAAALPSLDASTVLSRVLHPDDDSWSGYVTTDVELGLPAELTRLLAGPGGSVGPLSATSPTAAATDGVPFAATPAGVLGAVLSTDSTLRVWSSGSRLRAQLMQSLGEVDVVGDGSTWWTYSARDDVALKILQLAAAPSGTGAGPMGALLGAGSGVDFSTLSPQGLAVALLRQTSSSATVSLAAPQTIDGRTAYTLRVTPRPGTSTLLAGIDVAVDAVTGVALRVQVKAGPRPVVVLDSRLTKLDLARPSEERFAFVPSRTTQVRTWTSSAGAAAARRSVSHVELPAWDAVVRLDADAAGNPLLAWHGVSWRRVAALGVASGGGARVVRTPALTVLVTADERAYAGAVPESVLVARAANDARRDAAEALSQEYVPPPSGASR